MTESLIYSIPIELIDRFRGQRVIVRVFNPAKLTEILTEEDLKYLHYVQLQTPAADTGVLANWGVGMPIDIVMGDPETEFGRLYDHAKLLDKHPIRVTIPVRAGVANAVKIAASLQFAVKLAVSQPGPEDLAEMSEALEIFLHKPAFTQPVEFYHGLLRSFLHGEKTTVWAIQEEDPSLIRHITTEGAETISPRFLNLGPGQGLDGFVDRYLRDLLIERRECVTCQYIAHCSGYFKWPDKDYVCARGVMDLFHTIKSTAGELKSDLAVYAESAGRGQL